MAPDTERQQFIDYIRERGMRVTPERMALLDEIYRQHGHIDAEDLLAGVEAAGHSVSRATVYRTLDLLVDCGLVQRQRLGRNRYLYEHLHPGQGHDHLACRACGRVVEFVSPGIQAMLTEICRAHGFDKDDRQLQILGVCERCAAGEEGHDTETESAPAPQPAAAGGHHA